MDNLSSLESLLEGDNKAIPHMHTSSISSLNTLDINEKIDGISLSSISITSDGIIKASPDKNSKLSKMCYQKTLHLNLSS